MNRFLPVQAIQKLVKRGGLIRLDDAGVSRSGMPDGTSIINAPRLLMALRGTANFKVAGDRGGVRRIALTPGGALYVPCMHWVKAVPAVPYLSLGLIFYPDRTRFYIVESEREGEVWHTRMRAADERAALSDPLVGDLFTVLSKPASDPVTVLRKKAAANLLLAECAELAQPDEVKKLWGKAWQHWQAAKYYVDGHLQEPLDRRRVAAVLRIHPNHLSRLFKNFNDLTFNRYIAQARMARAELLLADAALNVSDIAYLCGYTSPNYFVRLYRLTHGCPPGKHRALDVSG